jgi:Na+/H+ antiporter NhaD/arsenite permease-like protein
MFHSEIVAIAVFLLAYILFVAFPERRTIVAIAGAGLLVILQAVTLKEAFGAINWNVMGIFVGTLIIADIFMESRMPAYLAEKIVNRSPSTLWSILWICIMTSFISAFVENVATVLIMAPIALALARKLKINPTVILISIAICSNLQGTATLIGDPPSMLLGGFAKMNFMDFFFYKGKPSIFFAVQAGALVSFVVLYFVFRKHREKVTIVAVENVRSWVPTIILVSLIFSLAGSSFLDTGFSYLAGIICVIFGVVALLWEKLVNQRSILHGLKKLDWETTFFLMGIFIIVGSVTATGWIEKASVYLAGIIGTNIFAGYTLLVLGSMVLSAFIDNVPFLVAMLPVAISISQKIGVDPSLFLFGLLIGTSLGGNITPIGASANIVACGLLKKEGYKVSFWDFMKIGLPFTIASVGAGYIFIWFFWAK